MWVETPDISFIIIIIIIIIIIVVVVVYFRLLLLLSSSSSSFCFISRMLNRVGGGKRNDNYHVSSVIR